MSLDWMIERLDKQTSSLSDTDSYRNFCALAAGNDATFSVFRRRPAYTRVLEHVTEEQGRQYIAEIRRINETMLDDTAWFKANDRYGGPVMFDYSDVGLVSPTTLRYAKVARELQALFGVRNLHEARVVEIGGGYGGQARVLKALFPVVQYTVVDLPEPLALAQRYLSLFELDQLQFVNGLDAPAFTADIFLSNYALTECTPAVMRGYVERIALNCPRGYITGNAQEKLLFELLAPLKPERREEVPLTGEGNFLCVWGCNP